MRFQCASSVRGSGDGQNAMLGSALVKSEKPNARMLTGGSANLSLCVARERAKFLQHSLFRRTGHRARPCRRHAPALPPLPSIWCGWAGSAIGRMRVGFWHRVDLRSVRRLPRVERTSPRCRGSHHPHLTRPSRRPPNPYRLLGCDRPVGFVPRPARSVNHGENSASPLRVRFNAGVTSWHKYAAHEL